jgi:HAD superfamily hydrolase (TIGR01549 family)
MAGVAVSTVLLDIDGTLLDTREFILAAFEHTLAGAGLARPGRVDLAKLVGPPLESIYAVLAGDARAACLVEEHRSFQERNLALAVPFDGAAETLHHLRDRGLRLGAVTSRSRRTSLASLEAAGLLPLLGAVISAEDAPALKPDARHLRAALDALGAPDRGVAMVGDTPADIAGGRNIAALTVAALYGFHGAAVLEAEPDRTIGDIRELPGVLGL